MLCIFDLLFCFIYLKQGGMLQSFAEVKKNCFDSTIKGKKMTRRFELYKFSKLKNNISFQGAGTQDNS